MFIFAFTYLKYWYVFSSEVSKLNLDITTMIAFVSALTNGGSNYEFDDPLLNQQASWERLRPVKPQLDKFFQGKDNSEQKLL